MNRITRFIGIAKASVVRGKAKTVLFGLFIAISVLLLTAVVSFMRPLWYNVEHKINDHILNRECVVYLEELEEIPQDTARIKSLEHVKTVYFLFRSSSATTTRQKSRRLKSTGQSLLAKNC